MDKATQELVGRNMRYLDAHNGRNDLKAGIGMLAFALEESTATILAQQAEIERLKGERDAAIREMTIQARAAGEAIGKLEVSEMAGIVDGWIKRAHTAEAEIERLRGSQG